MNKTIKAKRYIAEYIAVLLPKEAASNTKCLHGVFGVIDIPLRDTKHAELLKSLQPVGHVGEIQDIVWLLISVVVSLFLPHC